MHIRVDKLLPLLGYNNKFNGNNNPPNGPLPLPIPGNWDASVPTIFRHRDFGNKISIYIISIIIGTI